MRGGYDSMAKHITQLNVETFRGIKDLELNDHGDINIVLGKNNSGKTSLLEAISAFKRPEELDAIVDFALTRQQVIPRNEIAESISYAFCKRKIEDLEVDDKYEYAISLSAIVNKSAVSISVIGELLEKPCVKDDDTIEVADMCKTFEGSIMTILGGKKITRQFEISTPEHISAPKKTNRLINISFIPHNANLIRLSYGALKEMLELGRKDQIIKMMQTFDDDIVDFNVIEQKILVTSKNNSTMPLFNYGSGIQNAILFIPLAIGARNGILLLDEIESAVHKEAMGPVFGALYTICKENNVQLFITSHSIEAVDEILQYIHKNGDLNDLRVITLNKLSKKNKTKAQVLSGTEAFEDRNTLQMELRV